MGKVLSQTDTSIYNLTNLNPFRYRGYYQDSESGFYYLISRYYDPVTHRFINADDRLFLESDLFTNNVYAYCQNNPIINIDCDGHKSNNFIGPLPMLKPGSLWQMAFFVSYSASLPVTGGKPNSTQSLYDKNGDLSQERTYDENGKAKTDTDYGHANHHPELESPHYHDWDWSSGNPKRGDARNIAVAICAITVCTIGIGILMLDDASVVGIADDFMIPVLAAGISEEVIYIMG